MTWYGDLKHFIRPAWDNQVLGHVWYAHHCMVILLGVARVGSSKHTAIQFTDCESHIPNLLLRIYSRFELRFMAVLSWADQIWCVTHIYDQIYVWWLGLCMDIPLIYMVREHTDVTAVMHNANNYESSDARLIAIVVLEGDEYDEDNKQVWNLLHPLVYRTLAWS